MGKRFIIDVNTDNQHLLDEAGYDAPVMKAQVTEEALGDLLSVLESSTTESYEDALSEEGVQTSSAVWIALAALCFLMGVSIGFLLYFKSSVSLKIEDYLRRCCPKRILGRGADPVLLTVVDRQSKESVKKDGEKSSDDENEETHKNSTAGNSPESKDGDAAEGDKGETNTEKAEGEDGKDGDRKSSSSSSDEDEEGSVRQRKKAAEGANEGDAAPETEEKESEQQQQQQEHQE